MFVGPLVGARFVVASARLPIRPDCLKAETKLQNPCAKMKLSICVKELGIVKRLAASVRRAVTLIVVRRTFANFGVVVAFIKTLV